MTNLLRTIPINKYIFYYKSLRTNHNHRISHISNDDNINYVKNYSIQRYFNNRNIINIHRF